MTMSTTIDLPREEDHDDDKKEDARKCVGKSSRKHTPICRKEGKLGNNVFSYGHVARAKLYIETMEEITDDVGKRFGKNRRHLLPKVPEESREFFQQCHTEVTERQLRRIHIL